MIKVVFDVEQSGLPPSIGIDSKVWDIKFSAYGDYSVFLGLSINLNT